LEITEMALVLTVLIVISALMAGCSTTVPTQENSPKIKVLVTVLPEAGYVQAVGGDKVEVFTVVPPGADPHTYEPSARNMVDFADADVYFSLKKGILPLEDNLVSRLSSMNPHMKVVETAPGIDLIFGKQSNSDADIAGNQSMGFEEDVKSNESPDPHVWVSLKNAPVMINHISDTLCSVDPANAPYYQANRDAVLTNITSMDNEIKGMLEKIPHKKFITTHDSWGYFARDYGLTQVVIGQEGKEVTSKDIETIINDARGDRITIIVTEPQYSRKAADMIASSVNGSIIMVDPLSPEMPQELKKLAIELSRRV